MIEIDTVAGRDPTPSATGHLRSVLARVVDKPGGIEVRPPTEAGQSTRREYSAAELRGIEERHRQTRTADGVASMYVLYVNGSFADVPTALAVAYSASSFAVFADQIDGAVTALVARSAIERSVLVHEAGHLMALVNLGHRSPREREDPEHPGHSSNPDSVMYWAVEDISVTSLLSGGPPDDFDADDRADLRDIKEGRL